MRPLFILWPNPLNKYRRYLHYLPQLNVYDYRNNSQHVTEVLQKYLTLMKPHLCVFSRQLFYFFLHQQLLKALLEFLAKICENLDLK